MTLPFDHLIGAIVLLIIVAFIGGFLCARDLYVRRRRREAVHTLDLPLH